MSQAQTQTETIAELLLRINQNVTQLNTYQNYCIEQIQSVNSKLAKIDAVETKVDGYDTRITNAQNRADQGVSDAANAITTANAYTDTNAVAKTDMDSASFSAYRYEIGQIYYFQDNIARAGMVPCNGTVINNFSTTYPKGYAWLSKSENTDRWMTLADYNTAHTATYYTNASSESEGWNGVGGVAKFGWDKTNNILYTPDLRGMFAEMVGLDSLALGGVHADGIRNITASSDMRIYCGSYNTSGAFTYSIVENLYMQGTKTLRAIEGVGFDASRVVPTGNQTKPRAYSSLACVFLGA